MHPWAPVHQYHSPRKKRKNLNACVTLYLGFLMPTNMSNNCNSQWVTVGLALYIHMMSCLALSGCLISLTLYLAVVSFVFLPFTLSNFNQWEYDDSTEHVSRCRDVTRSCFLSLSASPHPHVSPAVCPLARRSVASFASPPNTGCSLKLQTEWLD